MTWMRSGKAKGHGDIWGNNNRTMDKLFLFIFLFWVQAGIAQTENARFKSNVDEFEEFYNDGSYDSIFYSLSSDMQQFMPQETAQEYFERLKSQAGKIVDREIIGAQRDRAVYKTTFERAVFTLDITLDAEDNIAGFAFKPYLEEDFPELIRNKSSLILPFKDTWKVIWGGDTPEVNYHVENRAQKHAFDFVMVGKDGQTYRTDGKTNEDYYAFGQKVLAPCDGEVVLVVDGIKDNVPGEMNALYVPGNTVILKSLNDEYLVFAHFQQHAIKVKQGDRVKQGQLLGLCGNSGNSSEPHLHFHIQNIEDMNMATGVKTYFEQIRVNEEVKKDYSPQKGEKIGPL